MSLGNEQKILWTAGLTQNDREDTESEVLASRRLIEFAILNTTERGPSDVVEFPGDGFGNRGTRRRLAGGVDPPGRVKCRELG